MALIDVHAHILCQRYIDLLATHGRGEYEIARDVEGRQIVMRYGARFLTLTPPMFDPRARLDAMDSAGVTMQLLLRRQGSGARLRPRRSGTPALRHGLSPQHQRRRGNGRENRRSPDQPNREGTGPRGKCSTALRPGRPLNPARVPEVDVVDERLAPRDVVRHPRNVPSLGPRLVGLLFTLALLFDARRLIHTTRAGPPGLVSVDLGSLERPIAGVILLLGRAALEQDMRRLGDDGAR